MIVRILALAALLTSCASPGAPIDADLPDAADVQCSPRATYGCVCPSGYGGWQQCGEAGVSIGPCQCGTWDAGAE